MGIGGFFEGVARATLGPAAGPVERMLGVGGSGGSHPESEAAARYNPNAVTFVAAGKTDELKAVKCKEFVKSASGGDLTSILKSGSDRTVCPQLHPLAGVSFPQEVADFGFADAPKKLFPKIIPLSDLLSGFLSAVTISYDEKTGIGGIAQRFGDTPGRYEGYWGNFKEYTMSLAYADPLIRVGCMYKADGKTLQAMRLVTLSGQDSGWIGKADVDWGTVYWLEQRMSASPAGPTKFLPIYALDAWKHSGEKGLVMVSARHTYPYSIHVETRPYSGNADLGAGSETKRRVWRYRNPSTVTQNINLSENVTTATSHTVTVSVADSVSKSHSLSLGAAVMAEGMMMSANQTDTTTTTHTVTKTDSVTTTVSTREWFEFPLAVPPGAALKATLVSSRSEASLQATVTVDYAGAAAPSTVQLLFGIADSRATSVRIEPDA